MTDARRQTIVHRPQSTWKLEAGSRKLETENRKQEAGESVCFPSPASAFSRLQLPASSFWLPIICGLWTIVCSVGWAADRAEEPVTVRKTKEGLHFNLPADWPVEKRGGVMAPIPVEEYLAKKFQELDARLQAIEQRFNGFDVRLRVVEEQLKASSNTLQSIDRSP